METESILKTIRKMIGLPVDCSDFDTDLIIHINSAFSTLKDLGAGPSEGYKISGEDNTWSEFIGDNIDLEKVKNYVYLKTRLIFDPPQSSSVLDAYKQEIKELEWRINVAVDTEESQNGK